VKKACANDEILLEIKNLRVCYEVSRGFVKAVDKVNLKIGKKEIVGLVGESGCGKSTLAFSILGILPSNAKILDGKILFNNIDLCKLTEEELRKIRGKKISIIFQDPSTYLNPVMKIEDQLAEVIQDNYSTKEEVKEEIARQLELLRLSSSLEITKRYPHELSVGMQQRVLIAAALLPKPDLVIADEPTTALDVTVQAQILQLIKELIDKIGCSFLLITHDLGIVAELCTKVFVMYAGKIVESADVFTLYEKPQHPYTIGLLESVLSIDEFKEHIQTIKGTPPNLLNPPRGCRFSSRCPYTMDVCSRQEPPLIEVEPGHVISCWLTVKK